MSRGDTLMTLLGVVAALLGVAILVALAIMELRDRQRRADLRRVIDRVEDKMLAGEAQTPEEVLQMIVEEAHKDNGKA